MSTSLPPEQGRSHLSAPPAHGGATGHTLPVGTQLEGLEIVDLIGEGGFGIVYLAYDASLQRQVAIKEYMPSSLAARAADSWQVRVRSESRRDTFDAGLKSFVNEARLLARFDHPALVKVFRFWETNSTAYMAMPYYRGPTLKQALAALGERPDEAQLRAWLRPLLDALSVMHGERCFHRDIAPDNILLTERGPLLLDFGAARRVIGDMTQALTVVLKPGFAPIEQYGESSAMVQGPWTDLYAIASVVHYAIIGRAPTSSVERIMEDTLEPLSLRAAGSYSDSFLGAIDAALAVRPKDRPQDVAAFCALLNRGLEVDSPGWIALSNTSESGTPISALAPTRLATNDTPPTRPPTPASTPVRVATQSPPARTEAAAPLPPDPGSPAGIAPRWPGSRAARYAAVMFGVLALAGVATLVAIYSTGRREPAPIHAEPAASPASQLPASSLATPPAPGPQAQTPAPPPTAAVPAPAPTASAPTLSPTAAAPSPTAAAPAPATDPPRAVPSAPPSAPPGKAATTRTPAQPSSRATPEAAAHSGSANPARCSDILQKASLESLTTEEVSYLKRECR